jgi:hypothetical protein
MRMIASCLGDSAAVRDERLAEEEFEQRPDGAGESAKQALVTASFVKA